MVELNEEDVLEMIDEHISSALTLFCGMGGWSIETLDKFQEFTTEVAEHFKKELKNKELEKTSPKNPQQLN
jgi:hypothetical protein